MDKWNSWYKDLKKEDIGSFRYSDTVTYQLGYDFLKDCTNIEDWGCGTGGFKRFFSRENSDKYIGIDGSITPFSDIKADLTQYTSKVDGIFMRHILEHNYEWENILHNACKSFNKKMCLILFTPFSENETKEIAHNLQHGVDVPDLSFNKDELIKIFTSYNIKFKLESVKTSTGYNIEHIFYLEKRIDLAFYTCFYGSDTNSAFQIPKLPSLKYNCYYYTNNNLMMLKLKDTNWIAIYDDKPTTDDFIESCMAGKHIKTSPHEYKELQDYSYLCFLDSKLEKVNETFVEDYIKTYFIEKNYALLLRKHHFLKKDKISVWDEYHQSMWQERYRLETSKYINYITNQTNKGLADITDYHCMCGFLIRNMKHEKIKELNTTWYQHIQECGIQDQISFFFVKQLFHDYIYSFSEIPFIQS
jgi:hypothetical protein